MLKTRLNLFLLLYIWQLVLVPQSYSTSFDEIDHVPFTGCHVPASVDIINERRNKNINDSSFLWILAWHLLSKSLSVSKGLFFFFLLEKLSWLSMLVSCISDYAFLSCFSINWWLIRYKHLMSFRISIW